MAAVILRAARSNRDSHLVKRDRIAADIYGFQQVIEGKNFLDGGNPILHASNFKMGTFNNLTYKDHWFHSGAVENRLQWEGNKLMLVSEGYGRTIPGLVINHAIGAIYFKPWQGFVKAQVSALRGLGK